MTINPSFHHLLAFCICNLNLKDKRMVEDMKCKFHVALEQNDALLKQNQSLQSSHNEEFVSIFRNDRLC
jgi:hypothetical protein